MGDKQTDGLRQDAAERFVTHPTMATISEHLATLGLSEGADADAIKAAYRRRALKMHPDKPGGDADAFKKLQGAYEALTGKAEVPPQQQQQQQQQPGFGFGGFPGGFHAAFSGGFPFFQGGFGAGPSQPPPVVEVTVRLPTARLARPGPVTLSAEANRRGPCRACEPGACKACGGSGRRELQMARGGGGRVTANVPCHECSGGGRGAADSSCAACSGSGTVEERVTVTVESKAEDVTHGTRVMLSGHGSHDPRTGGRSDMLLTVAVELPPDTEVSVDGQGHVTLTIGVGVADVLCGFRRTATPCGDQVTVSCDGPADFGREVRLPQRGLAARGGGRGDLVVRLRLAPTTVAEAGALRSAAPALRSAFRLPESVAATGLAADDAADEAVRFDFP